MTWMTQMIWVTQVTQVTEWQEASQTIDRMVYFLIESFRTLSLHLLAIGGFAPNFFVTTVLSFFAGQTAVDKGWLWKC